MGRIHRCLGLDRRPRDPRASTTPTHKRAQYACDITYGTNNEFGFDYLRDNMAMSPERAGAAGPRLRHRRRGRLDPHRRGPHAAHHLGPGRRRGASSTTSSPPSSGASRATCDYEVDEEKRTVVPTEEGIEKVEKAARRREPLRRRQPEPRPPAPGRPPGQGAVQARQGLHRPGRRGEDRRRVHRPHPRGPPLVRGPAPGRRGQGGREDQGGEPDPRHDHPPELLPHVRQARRHDRHGPDRGRRVRAAPTTSQVVPIPTNRPMVRADQADLIYKTEDAKFDAVVDDIAERYEHGPAGARRHDLGREVRAAVAAAREAGHRRTRC